MTNTDAAQLGAVDLDKPLPCPFCSGPARIESSAMWIDLICDHDKTCCLDGDTAELSYQNAAGSREQMLAKWNRRDLIAQARAASQAQPAGAGAPSIETWMHRLGPRYNDSKEPTEHEIAMEAEIADLRNHIARQGAASQASEVSGNSGEFGAVGQALPVDDFAVRFIEQRAEKYLQDHACTEPDTGATVFQYGEAGREYHSTLVELADDIRKAQAVCTVPPPGWSCTRAAGHDGPCAAVPVERAGKHRPDCRVTVTPGFIIRDYDAPAGLVTTAASLDAAPTTQAQPAGAPSIGNDPIFRGLAASYQLAEEVCSSDASDVNREAANEAWDMFIAHIDAQLARQGAAPAQAEPVAWMDPKEVDSANAFAWKQSAHYPQYTVPVYTTAPAHAGAAQADERRELDAALRNEVSIMHQMLDAGEWAEQIAVTPEGQCLETAITKLVGHAAPTQPAAPNEDARDAVRYRWLRDNCYDYEPSGEDDAFDHPSLHFESSELDPYDSGSLDEAIDAAIRSSSNNTGSKA